MGYLCDTFPPNTFLFSPASFPSYFFFLDQDCPTQHWKQNALAGLTIMLMCWQYWHFINIGFALYRLGISRRQDLLFFKVNIDLKHYTGQYLHLWSINPDDHLNKSDIQLLFILGVRILHNNYEYCSGYTNASLSQRWLINDKSPSHKSGLSHYFPFNKMLIRKKIVKQWQYIILRCLTLKNHGFTAIFYWLQNRKWYWLLLNRQGWCIEVLNTSADESLSMLQQFNIFPILPHEHLHNVILRTGISCSSQKY